MFGFFQKPSRENFAQIVQARIRERTGQTGFKFNSEDFSLSLGTQRINLDNLYHEYCQKKGKERDTLLSSIADFARANFNDSERSLDEVAPHLVIVVRERLLVSLAEVNWGMEPFEGKKVPPPVHDPISRWFLRALVIDAPTHMAYVNDEHLRQWNLSSDEAFALGLANLKAATTPKFVEEDGIYVGRWGDAYDASRVLIPGLFDDLPIEGDPVFVLPNRDTLFVTDSAAPAKVQAMLERAEALVKELPRAQNIAPLTLRGGELADYEVPPQSPIFSAVTRAKGLAILSAYVEQKAVLEKVLERGGKDVYVGEFSLTRKDGGEAAEYRSYCVWSKGVPTLLPVADDVVFFDPTLPDGGKALARLPWAKVRDGFSDLLLDTQMYPPRYYVSKFPESEQLPETTVRSV